MQEAARGRKLSEEDLASLRAQLMQEKYQRLLRELLRDLRRRAAVRVLDPLDGAGTVAAGQ